MALIHASSRKVRFVCCLSAVALLSSARSDWFSVPRPSNEEDGTSRRRRKRPRRESVPVFYSHMRPDRAGAVIQDMLLAHAFAFGRNLTYGGACPPTSGESDERRRSTSNLTADQVSALLSHLGLDDVLPIACPPPPSEHTTPPRPNPRAGPLVDRKYYGRYHLRYCTSEWQRYMRAKVQRRIDDANRSPHNTVSQHQQPTAHQAAACVLHIRRGDVTPCDPSTMERYLPNSYYRALLERHVPAHNRVTIYSERNSVEPWDDFRNFTLILGGGEVDDRDQGAGATTSSSSMRDLANIWLDMMAADVLILSKSSFSLVPALLSGAPPTPSSSVSSPTVVPQIVYTDFWMDPLPHWTRVPQSLQRQAAVDVERVKKQHCTHLNAL